jgi:hypothetical protein
MAPFFVRNPWSPATRAKKLNTTAAPATAPSSGRDSSAASGFGFEAGSSSAFSSKAAPYLIVCLASSLMASAFSLVTNPPVVSVCSGGLNSYWLRSVSTTTE